MTIIALWLTISYCRLFVM